MQIGIYCELGNAVGLCIYFSFAFIFHFKQTSTAFMAGSTSESTFYLKYKLAGIQAAAYHVKMAKDGEKKKQKKKT